MVDLVVQFSPPQNISDYVHRVGRTARAGRTGQGILFLSPNEIEFIRMLEAKRIRFVYNLIIILYFIYINILVPRVYVHNLLIVIALLC